MSNFFLGGLSLFKWLSCLCHLYRCDHLFLIWLLWIRFLKVCSIQIIECRPVLLRIVLTRISRVRFVVFLVLLVLLVLFVYYFFYFCKWFFPAECIGQILWVIYLCLLQFRRWRWWSAWFLTGVWSSDTWMIGDNWFPWRCPTSLVFSLTYLAWKTTFPTIASVCVHFNQHCVCTVNLPLLFFCHLLFHLLNPSQMRLSFKVSLVIDWTVHCFNCIFNPGVSALWGHLHALKEDELSSDTEAGDTEPEAHVPIVVR